MTKPRAGTLETRQGRAIATLSALTALAALAALSGCASSPTTTYVSPSGAEVTVDWADYPGSPGVDANDVLAAPPQEDIEQVEAELIADIKMALGAEFDLDWQTEGEAQWFPAGGNGFGAESAYVVFNSQSHVSDTVPDGADDWHLVVDIVTTITASRGLGPVELDHELDHEGADADDLGERFGTDDPDEYWQWWGDAYGSSQWLSVALTDVSKDDSGEAAAERSNFDWPEQSIALSYGATTLPRGGWAEFELRLAPFAGLDVPTATTSD
ncbi:hypothetical protein [Marisediminicola antarctica]|uniref:Uncharacterized protein n=1 Tax=Marisediminicola antarctica TaxID=674079 RepID=A0A7L5AKP4_9MICO|nr:hypothetical protein [Marisediminicola antarctica]QHO69691.1 hypothetical protein BHD05_08605 [Marisediminicola antarctica]